MIEVREYLDKRAKPICNVVQPARQDSRGKGGSQHRSARVGKLFPREGVGGGVFEFKLDYGPGFRIYFGRDGEAVVILLGGGSKKRQSRDIQDAMVRWSDYRERKKLKGK